MKVVVVVDVETLKMSFKRLETAFDAASGAGEQKTRHEYTHRGVPDAFMWRFHNGFDMGPPVFSGRVVWSRLKGNFDGRVRLVTQYVSHLGG